MQPKPQLPDKLYFKIGEVSKLTQLPAYVLRFWENEFSCIRPKRTSSGQRLYRRGDVEMVFKIRHLLHERKFTIEGARQYISKRKTGQKEEIPPLKVKEIEAELKAVQKHCALWKLHKVSVFRKGLALELHDAGADIPGRSLSADCVHQTKNSAA